MAKADLTAQQLRDLLSYAPDTGVFTWRIDIKCKGGVRPAGSQAGCKNGKGYVEIGIGGRAYYAHRLAWLYVYGRWPAAQIDHINRHKADNRIANLRDTSGKLNMHNRDTLPGVSGCVGVHPTKNGRWTSRITVAGLIRTLGTFPSKKDAADAYQRAKQTVFEELSHISQTTDP